MIFACQDGVWRCRPLDEGPEGTPANEVMFANPHKVRETARHGKALTFAAAMLRAGRALAEHGEARL